jgi:RimJ/RimL family protein N-acetyltransferase
VIYPKKNVILPDGTAAVFRPPVARDAAEMVAYLKGCAEETPFLLRSPEECAISARQEAAFLQEIRRSPQSVMIVCEIDGKIAGNCQLSLNRHQKTRHRASVAIALRQAYWGKGIGTALFEEMIRLAQASGVTQLELEYVEGNDRARRLYDKMGFVPYGEHPDAIRLPDGSVRKEILMLKRL